LPQPVPDTYAVVKDAAQAASPPVKESPPSTTLVTGRENTPVKPAPQLALEASALRNNSMEAPPAPAASALLGRQPAAESAKTRLRFEQSRMMAASAPERSHVEPGVLWSINASPDTSGNSFGGVERSLDRGKTWEAVHVNDGVSFRAVAAAGLHVWAGGSGGALFHSSDGGLHWVQVTVATAYTTLTGTIVSIRAEYPSRLRITTSSGEEWSSSDGGSQWTRE
jgi:hypothetical protein